MTELRPQHSIVDPDALLGVINQHYPTINAGDCRLLALGCNDNYRIQGKRQDYAFRLYRYQWWPARDVDEELRLLEALHRNRIDVCRPVRTKEQARHIRLRAPEGDRLGALFNFIPGRPLARNFGPRRVHLSELGRMIAQVHTAADRMKRPVQRWVMDFDAMVTPFLDGAPRVLEHRPKDMAYLHRLAGRLFDILHTPTAGELDVGLCHGDLHTHNVMVQPDGRLTLFDFDWCGVSWRAYDLATIWWSLPRDTGNDRHWRTFLSAYTKLRPLTRQEHRLMPWFVVLRQFELLTFQLAMRKHVGDAWLNDNYYDFHLGFLKRWVKQRIDN